MKTVDRALLIILRGACGPGCSLVSVLESEKPSLSEGIYSCCLGSWLGFPTAAFPRVELTLLIVVSCLLAAEVFKVRKKAQNDMGNLLTVVV